VATIHIDPAVGFKVQFIGSLPLDWQVIRVRQGQESVIAHGSTARNPPPPPDTAQIPSGQFSVGDTFRWNAEMFAPPNSSSDYKLRVEATQSGKVIYDSDANGDGPITGTIAANDDKVESRDSPCV
jgi:hypothetical protein